MKPWLPSPVEERPDSPLEDSSASVGLPSTQPASDLPRSNIKKRWLALCFFSTLIVYLIFVPRFVRYSSPPTGDQAFYLMVTMSIVQDGDLNIANNYANRDEDKFYRLAPHPPDFVGMGAPYPLPPHNAFSSARPPSEWYNFHLPGLSLLIAPAWAIGGLFSLWWPATVVFMCAIGALLAVNVFLLAHEITGKLWIAVAVWMPLCFSNPIMSYSYMIFTELPVGLLLLYAFRRLALGWGSNGTARLLLVGLCIGFMPWVSWRCIVIVGPLGLYALFQWWRHWRAARNEAQESPGDQPSPIRSLLSGLWVFVPSVAGLALLAWYNFFLYGSILQPEKSNELGDAPLFTMPWQGLEGLTRFIMHGFAMLFDRQMGLLTYAPIYLLSIVGIIAMFRSIRHSDRRLVIWGTIVIGPYVFMLMSYYYWNGLWNPPARFPTSLVPLMAAPLGFSLWVLSRSWLYKATYALFSAIGIFLMSLLIYDARLMWPGDPVFGWLANAPESPLRVDLYNLLPAYGPLDERRLPTNTAWQFVAGTLIVLLFYLLMARAPAFRNTRRLPYSVHGVAWLGIIALLGSSWFAINYEYIKHKTILTEQHRWQINAWLNQPRGITYLDGKIYIAVYDGKSVVMVDTRISASYLVTPTTQLGALSYAQPGDIKVGPDNLLYLLNNGPGNEALYVMKPDGEVVKAAPLNGKSEIAIGLAFGPDGNMYVSDMRGGRVIIYPRQGGEAYAVWGGESGGFNNASGIAIDADGSLYIAETSNQVVQHLDSKGQFVRKFALSCAPQYLAISGDWVDVTCNKGIFTINKKSGQVQASEVAGDAPELTGPWGLTYGPDGTLYVLDNNNIIAYKVQH